MWQVANRTPFAAAQSWIRNLHGAETWIVAVKATFDVLADGATRVSREQPPPNRAAVYRGDPARSSIAYENDFPLGKTTTDVVLNGSAYAPAGRPATSVGVAFRVGAVAKALRVVGDRSWNVAGILSDPQPFVSMPITYERAYGGVDATSEHPERDWFWPNPAGTGFAVSERAITHVRVPNVEYPNEPISSWQSRYKPAGFGVIGAHWQDRAKLAGTYDAAWSARRQPLPPEDFDLRYHQAVPQDQQAPAFLQGGETVSLKNLTVSGRLDFLLPPIRLRLETRFTDGERRRHDPPRLHTVILEPEYPRVSLVWHSAVECHAKVYKLDHTRVELASSNGEPQLIGNLLDL